MEAAIMELYFYQSIFKADSSRKSTVVSKGMGKSKTRQNHNASWSDLTHDVLILIMMKVGVVDFLAFSRVCKSWRQLALSNKNKFMEFIGLPPMLIRIRRRIFRGDCCYLQDSYGRKIKRTLQHSGGRTLIGTTCGYLILLGKKTYDFWLENPIKRHALHFPALSYRLNYCPDRARAILVFSPSMSGWVFVMVTGYGHIIWYSIAGKGAWDHFTSNYRIIDLHVVREKIYAITTFFNVCEVRLHSQPKVTFLETKSFPDEHLLSWNIVSSGENLYVTGNNAQDEYNVWELDRCEIKWVPLKNRIRYLDLNRIGYAYFPHKIPERDFPRIWFFPNDWLSA